MFNVIITHTYTPHPPPPLTHTYMPYYYIAHTNATLLCVRINVPGLNLILALWHECTANNVAWLYCVAWLNKDERF